MSLRSRLRTYIQRAIFRAESGSPVARFGFASLVALVIFGLFYILWLFGTKLAGLL